MMPVALLLVALLGLPQRAAADEPCSSPDECDGVLPKVSLLQLKRQVRPRGESRPKTRPSATALFNWWEPRDQGDHPEIPRACLEPHDADFNRSIREVTAEHPGVDPWCYYGWRGIWASACATARIKRSFTYFVETIGYPLSISSREPLRTFRYNGGAFTSRNHAFPYDDLYCHGNGWLSGQRLQAPDLSDFEANRRLAEEECRRLSGRFPVSQLSIGDMERRTVREIGLLQEMLGGRGSGPASVDMQRHAAVKCSLGGVGCDLSYCLRFQLLPNGTICHSPNECAGL
mmetsp:Transcript_21057/g.60770  ORF Transcript_21057/g.60770 Transcript_21057/m.60770 type:complete len:288 (+) Transcript_21057:67-930(+)